MKHEKEIEIKIEKLAIITEKFANNNL